MDRHPISPEGYDKLRADLKEIEEVKKPAVAENIKVAREEGDLGENAEYHGQREQLAYLERQAGLIRIKLNSTYIVDKSKMPKGVVSFGSTVTVKDLDDGSEETYEFVGPGEEDYTGDIMKILTSSPLAQGLTGKKVGDQVEVEIPKGTLKLEVVKIVDG